MEFADRGRDLGEQEYLENVVLGLEGVTIEDACGIYETILGRGDSVGFALSGGQNQRLFQVRGLG